MNSPNISSLPTEAIVPTSLIQDLVTAVTAPLAVIEFAPGYSGYQTSDVYKRVCEAKKIAESDLTLFHGQTEITVAAWVLNELTSFARIHEKLAAVTARIASRRTGGPDPVEKTAAKFRKLERFIKQLDTTCPDFTKRSASNRPR